MRSTASVPLAALLILAVLALASCSRDSESHGTPAVAPPDASDAAASVVGVAQLGPVAPIAFACDPPGPVAPQALWLQSVGTAPLAIHGFTLQASADLGVLMRHPTGEWYVILPGQTTFTAPLLIPPGDSLLLTVAFQAAAPGVGAGKLTVQTNAQGVLGETAVALTGCKRPCLKVEPATALDLGPVWYGESAAVEVRLAPCNAVPVEMYSVAFQQGGDAQDFAITWPDATSLGISASGPSAQTPLVLSAGTQARFEVGFSNVFPTSLSVHEAVLTVQSNAAPLQIPVSARAQTKQCAYAVVTADEPPVVLAGTPLHLHGEGSWPPAGRAIAGYKWTAKRPAGSAAAFSPAANVANPTFTPDLAGSYELCVAAIVHPELYCPAACLEVTAMPDHGLQVELDWHTPGDAVPGDSTGADLDLHLAHPLAAGLDLDCDGAADPWFSDAYDAAWFNPQPAWGSADPAAEDDAWLEADSAGDATLEAIVLTKPQGTLAEPFAYALGVHCWDDHGLGNSLARVRIFVHGVLAHQSAPVPIAELDLWYVGRLNWPNALVGGSLPVLTECWQSGDACLGVTDPANPKAGKLWQAAGAPCLTPCRGAVLAKPGGVASGVCGGG